MKTLLVCVQLFSIKVSTMKLQPKETGIFLSDSDTKRMMGRIRTMTAPIPSSAVAVTSIEPDYGVCHLRLGKSVLSRYTLLTERIPVWHQT